MLNDVEVAAIAADIWHAEQTGELAEAPSSRHPDVTTSRRHDRRRLCHWYSGVITGHETTRSTAAHFVNLMSQYLEQYELLLSDVDGYLENSIEEVLRFTRENARKHLSFGTGPHVCTGARSGSTLSSTCP